VKKGKKKKREEEGGKGGRKGGKVGGKKRFLPNQSKSGIIPKDVCIIEHTKGVLLYSQ